MWILALDDRLYWLLNGKKYTIGRASSTAAGSIDFVVTKDSSVSRKHATLEIRNSSEDAIMHPSIRSDVIITDLGSRFGTKVDGEQLASGSTCNLPQTPNGMSSIRLGRATKIRLRWYPFVVTYSTGQQGAAHSTLWEHAINLLNPLDVKLMPYIVKSTDIFVKTGKVTSSLYYALTRQIPIVNNHYFEALKTTAEKYSTEGTLKHSVLPDPAPFLPDPLWVPNPKRAECLSGTVFKIPNPKHAEALLPILESAGATSVDPQSNSNSADAIALYSSEIEAQQAVPNSKYTVERAVFQAIVEGRPLNTEDIRFAPSQTRAIPNDRSSGVNPSGRGHKRKRPELNIFDIMTSQDTKPTPPLTSPSKVELDIPNQEEPVKPARHVSVYGNAPLLPQPPGPPTAPRTAKRQRTSNADINSGRHVSSQTNLEKQEGQAAAGQLAVNESSNKGDMALGPSQKKNSREKNPIPEAPEPKRHKFTETMLIEPSMKPFNQRNHTQNEVVDNEEESDVSPVDYDTVGELAIVEASLPTNDVKPHTSQMMPRDPRWEKRPNFKAFKKPGHSEQQQTMHHRVVPFDEEAPNSRFDYDDFDAYDGANDTTTSHTSSRGLANLAQLTSTSKSWLETNPPVTTTGPGNSPADKNITPLGEDEEESEENLFVDSNEDEDNESIFESDAEAPPATARSQPRARTRARSVASQMNDSRDDDFGFSFS